MGRAFTYYLSFILCLASVLWQGAAHKPVAYLHKARTVANVPPIRQHSFKGCTGHEEREHSYRPQKKKALKEDGQFIVPWALSVRREPLWWPVGIQPAIAGRSVTSVPIGASQLRGPPIS